MKNAVIVSAVRTPVGKRGGVYKTLQRLDLTTPVVKEALKRANITSDMVEENIWGNIPMYLTPSRYVWLSADGNIDTAFAFFDKHRDRFCGVNLGPVYLRYYILDLYARVKGGTQLFSVRYYARRVKNEHAGCTETDAEGEAPDA